MAFIRKTEVSKSGFRQHRGLDVNCSVAVASTETNPGKMSSIMSTEGSLAGTVSAANEAKSWSSDNSTCVLDLQPYLDELDLSDSDLDCNDEDSCSVSVTCAVDVLKVGTRIHDKGAGLCTLRKQGVDVQRVSSRNRARQQTRRRKSDPPRRALGTIPEETRCD
eukprot:TRINITY_DN24381_c0_g1_i1.p1 TRINITY_DN24381_c0_g1~~TRINITY_DN24381_c0_g1_i1.p1  ORF type:complete len:164 (-),score=8.10 TRINITY_DN24381_c0_g1_i1:225-716(-)